MHGYCYLHALLGFVALVGYINWLYCFSSAAAPATAVKIEGKLQLEVLQLGFSHYQWKVGCTAFSNFSTPIHVRLLSCDVNGANCMVYLSQNCSGICKLGAAYFTCQGVPDLGQFVCMATSGDVTFVVVTPFTRDDNPRCRKK